MNILYTFNHGFIPQVSASIASICENNKLMDDIHFYLMVLDVSEKKQQK